MMQVYPSPAEGIGLENRQRINVLRGFESLIPCQRKPGNHVIAGFPFIRKHPAAIGGVLAFLTIYAYCRRPFGTGISRPNSRAVSIHSCATIWTLCSASVMVLPSAMHPDSSGISAIKVPTG